MMNVRCGAVCVVLCVACVCAGMRHVDMIRTTNDDDDDNVH